MNNNKKQLQQYIKNFISGFFNTKNYKINKIKLDLQYLPVSEHWHWVAFQSLHAAN